MRNKYGNRKVEIDGHVFDSKKEAKYYMYLRELEKAGEVSDLRLQVPYELIPPIYENVAVQLKTKTKVVRKCVQKPVHYLADFVYTDVSGNDVVVDVKSSITRKNGVYILKKKMMKAFCGIDIQEI